MPVRGTPSTATYTAVNISTGIYLAGDAANHTLFVTTDGTRVAATSTPVSLGNGQYSLLLSAAQMTGDLITIDGTSTTANVAIIQKDMATTTTGSGNGAFPVTIIVTDGTNPISNATVRLGNLAPLQTNGSGVVTYSVNAGTYSISITNSGYSYSPTSQVIDSSGHFANTTSTLTAAMTIVTLPTPTVAGTVIGYLTALDDTLTAQSGVRFRFRLATGDGIAGRSVKAEYFYATSDVNGLVTTTFLQNATYIGERQTSRSGNYGTQVTIVVGAVTPLAIPQVLGNAA